MSDYRKEDVLKHAQEAFSETIALKIKQLRRYIEKGKNPTLTGNYIEAMVRGFVKNWIGSLQLCHGSFYSQEFAVSGKGPLQIDGIVYDPTAGPPIIMQDDFIIVHPVFCTSVIEIKTSITSIKGFETRLQEIYSTYFHHATKPQVMGIVIADKEPDKISITKDAKGNDFPFFNYSCANLCPIFVLFKEDGDEYTPYTPAIDAMISAVYRNQFSAGNYIH